MIAHPLARIAVEMERAGGFDIAPHVARPSVFREINAMDRALGAMKGGLGSFAAYVPRDLVRAVLATGTRAELGGRTKTLSVFFSDLAGFTTLSEKLAPDALANLLGKLLRRDDRGHLRARRHDRQVHRRRHHGVLERARRRARARRARVSTPRWRVRRASTSCGARSPSSRTCTRASASQPATCSSATSARTTRMNYTVMGDTANLASRLEGLNKAYGTPVMISDATRTALGDAVVARPIDVVAVKGRSAGVRVYEPLTDTPKNRELAAACARALDAYLARDFAAAARAWEDALAVRPGDEACETMRARALAYAVTPPPAEWSGVHVMHEK